MKEQTPEQHSRTETIREIIELGKIVYTLEGWKAFKDAPLPRDYDFEHHHGETPRQLIAEGKTDVVLGVLAAQYEGTDIV
jgi:hypothetical protein